MPTKPAKVCCRCSTGVVLDDVCDNGCKAAKKSKELDRPSSTARGYGADWQKFRRLYFYHNSPFCHDCTTHGRTRSASELHHKKKIRHRPDLRLDPDNLLPLCKRCHDARSARGE